MSEQQIIVRSYIGTQAEAAEDYQADSEKMAAQGYYPTSQSWAPGAYGCGAFLLAFILCFVLIGVVVFVYMLIVKPAGTLSVTYERRAITANPEISIAEKTCPRCAEQVKAAAVVCRYCRYEFLPVQR